jgi:hypothetical protein
LRETSRGKLVERWRLGGDRLRGNRFLTSIG